MIQVLKFVETDLDQFFERNWPVCIYMHEVFPEELWSGFPHCHPNCEICYIFCGTGIITLNGHTYSAQAGDMFFIPQGVYHMEMADTTNPFHIIFLIIEHKGPQSERLNDMFKELCGCVRAQESSTVQQVFLRISKEIVGQKPGFLSVVNSLIKELYVLSFRSLHIERFVPNVESTAEANKHKDLFRQIDRYIYMNLNQQKASIKEIAKYFHYHPKYLSQLYKQEMGETLSEHINHMRLERAKEYLGNNEISLSVIVNQLGFSSMNSFYKMFKKHTGVTPGMYKKMLND